MTNVSQKDDTVFDARLGDALAAGVYGTTKGEVRLGVLWHDLLAELPELRDGKLRVIDVGAGLGQIATQLAELGHRVTLCDPSEEMLERARAAMSAAGLDQQARFVRAPAQQAAQRLGEQFDLVLCHAVLEWLAEPRRALEAVLPLLAPAGHLSLMFYNRNAALLKHALRGDLDALLADERPEGAPAPLDPDAVQGWLEDFGLRVQSRAGIRIFHDHLPEALQTPERLEQIMHLETEFRRREPFASLGQHVHFVCRWR
jgi:S-adenosylmethionine-dependent methyltransferase